MTTRRRHRGSPIALRRLVPALACACSIAAAAADEPALSVPETVQDLAWGEVLFDFYQDRHVPAITRLLVAGERSELTAHADEAELVLGGLYLGYGLHRPAADIFERLLQRRARPEVRDQAWYYLARIRYERGDPEGAAAAVEAIGEALPARFAAQRYDLEARILLDLGRADAAARLLAEAELPGGWRYFGLFNLGVALIRSGDPEGGRAWLDEVGRARVAGPELLTLRDRANLALGYERLLGGDAAGARAALDRVRLDGPYTTRALLGAGWAEAGQDDYRRALTPWIELGQRDRLDIAVQESLLAVPYAYSRLGADAQAAAQYEVAVRRYEAELIRLDGARTQVEAGALARTVLATDSGLAVTGGPIDRYLMALLAGQRFRVAADDLRATARLRRLLDERAATIDALAEMLSALRARYAEQRPRALAVMEDDRLAGLRLRHARQVETLRRVRAEQDVMAMATARERVQAARLRAVRTAAEAEPGEQAAADRARFLEGVLYWQIHTDFYQRLRAADKTSAGTGRVLAQAEALHARIRAAGLDEPRHYAAYEERIAAAAGRLETLRRRTGSVILAQSQYLEDLAVAELTTRRTRITDYLSQARFALAASYDRAAVAEAGE